ncbi:hypothetical protein [Jannaschia sp. W003]|uniref:hypothetical protein n=1 Tax=Jannaschia sp. W003 TaxID=2867012 RepID=UPI0021A29A0A|nr:hypothetical protein [Jannaschia sp. W003]UWQ21606.1 hypothetical protein K3554_00840 [Jannaschia sp. W003]
MRTVLSAVLIAAFAAPAYADENCAPRAQVVEQLSSGYGEALSGGGLQNDDALFEVWTSEIDGTWTILMTRADGLTCVMAAGTDWHPAAAAARTVGAPA